MRKIFFLVIVVFFCFSTKAQQNLVPNYCFNYISSCPPLQGINYATPWFQPNQAGNGTNIYNVCQTTAPNIPNTFSGYQYPQTGSNGFVGIVLFDDTTSPQLNWSREYIEVKLIASLKVSKKYCVGFYTNAGNNNIWAIKNIQTALTHDSLLYNDSNYGPIPNVTIATESPSIIKDTLNWVKIRDTYTALGGEQFLTIGNFSSGNQVVHQLVRPHNSVPSSGGYYLFNNVSVYEQPDVFAGNDTLVNPAGHAQLGTTGRSDIAYSWQPTTGLNNANIANPVAHPTVTTQYILTVKDTNTWACNSVMYDTVMVTVGFVGINEYNVNSIKLSVYPNPAVNEVICEAKLNGNEKGKIIICDLLSRELLIQPLNEGANKLRFDISNLVNGVYIYKVIVNDTPLQNSKLVIQR